MLSLQREKENNMKPLKIRTSITLDEDVYEKVKVLAENDDRSLSSYINLLLREHVEVKTKK